LIFNIKKSIAVMAGKAPCLLAGSPLQHRHTFPGDPPNSVVLMGKNAWADERLRGAHGEEHAHQARATPWCSRRRTRSSGAALRPTPATTSRRNPPSTWCFAFVTESPTRPGSTHSTSTSPATTSTARGGGDLALKEIPKHGRRGGQLLDLSQHRVELRWQERLGPSALAVGGGPGGRQDEVLAGVDSGNHLAPELPLPPSSGPRSDKDGQRKSL